MNQVRKDATYVYLDPEQEEGNPKVAIYVCQLEVDGQVNIPFISSGLEKMLGFFPVHNNLFLN